MARHAKDLGTEDGKTFSLNITPSFVSSLHGIGGREIDTAGDGFLAAFDGPARAVRCGRAIVDSVTKLGIDVRAGVRTGECEVIGEKLGGIAVHMELGSGH